MTVCMYRDIHTLQPYIISISELTALHCGLLGTCFQGVGYILIQESRQSKELFTVCTFRRLL